MNVLRQESEESAAKVEELQGKVKTLEQENLQKEQEITSLQHNKTVLETEVEKLEGLHSKAKGEVAESAQHGTQNESLQRKVQLLEDEAEANDKTLRETNEKYARSHTFQVLRLQSTDTPPPDSAKLMSKPGTTSAKCKPSRPSATSGSRSTRRWRRSTGTRRRSSTTSWRRLVTSKTHSTAMISPLLACHYPRCLRISKLCLCCC